MTTRRDFLRSFGAIVTGIVLAPATALAAVQRLGTPAEWVPRSLPGIFITKQAGRFDDPNTWHGGKVPTPAPGAEMIEQLHLVHAVEFPSDITLGVAHMAVHAQPKWRLGVQGDVRVSRYIDLRPSALWRDSYHPECSLGPHTKRYVQ